MSDKNKREFKDLLASDARTGKLGRRDFMRFAVAAGSSKTKTANPSRIPTDE